MIFENKKQPQSIALLNSAFPRPAEIWLPAAHVSGLLNGVPPSTEATFTKRSFGNGLVGINVTATGRQYSRGYFNGKSSYAWFCAGFRDNQGPFNQSIVRHDGVCTPMQEINGDTVQAVFWPGGSLQTWSYNSPTARMQNRFNTFSGRVSGSAASLMFNGVETTASASGNVTGTLASNSTVTVFGCAEGGTQAATAWGLSLVVFWEDTVPTVGQLRALHENPWQLFQPRPRRIFTASVVAGATTIDCTVGTATANGTAAKLDVAVNASVGTATASGTSAKIDIAVNASVGTATANGTTAKLDVAVNASVGTATANGTTAKLDVAVNASAGTATASGTAAKLDVAVNASVGTATANGIGASIDVSGATSINCAVGTATANGIACRLDIGISCTIGTATATGVTSDVAGILFVPVTGIYATGAVGDVITVLETAVAITGVFATGYVTPVNVWGLVNDAQFANWQDIADTQTPAWAAINDTQTSVWADVLH
jgi:hypothetical protein